MWFCSVLRSLFVLDIDAFDLVQEGDDRELYTHSRWTEIKKTSTGFNRLLERGECAVMSSQGSNCLQRSKNLQQLKILKAAACDSLCCGIGTCKGALYVMLSRWRDDIFVSCSCPECIEIVET